MASDFMQGDHDKSVAVPFSDDETEAQNDNALDDDKPDATPEERITRRQKRQERLNRLITEGKQSKEELARIREEQAATRAELERLKGYVSAQPAQRPSNDTGKDPYEARLDAVYEKQSQAYNAAQAEIKAGSFTPERQQYYERIAREVESEKTRIHTERVVDARSQSSRAEQAQEVWRQKYPEVYSNQRAYQYAEGTWRRKLAALNPGEAPTAAMVDEIMSETMTQFKLGPKPAPTASDRARMSGIPSAGSGGGKPAGVVLSNEMRRMAIAAHPDVSEADAIKKWVNTTGKRLREKKVI